jgi:glutamyl-tRNA synthetase
MTTVRTRFAPSPTGYMHIGGMRTALFNWLWARHNNGTFILRIDDTDEERNIEAALGPILQAFRWLNLSWDEGPEVGGPNGPYFQSQRKPLYTAAAQKLLAEGKAYRDFSTPEQSKADREACEREKRPVINVRRSLDLTPAEVEQYVAEGRPHVVRYLVPRDETISIDDIVRGHVEWNCANIPDPVLLRPNGTPLYNFATVIDDAAMAITHVIRAEEHLSNTPAQALLHKALGNTLPVFAHIPFVTAPKSGKKLSKREIEQYKKMPEFKKMFEKGDAVFSQIGLPDSTVLNPVMCDYYEKIGYLPEAVINALARLGWSLDDHTEIMSLETIVTNFTLDRVVKNPAGFDPDKLFSFQSHWMNDLPADKKIDGCLPYLVKSGLIPLQADGTVAPDVRLFVGRIVAALGDRLKLFGDILDVGFFFRDELMYDEKTFQKRVKKEGVPELLRGFRAKLATTDDWSPANLEAVLNAFSTEKGEQPATLIHALRLCVTGQGVGPGVYDCASLVGKERALTRIDAALAR